MNKVTRLICCAFLLFMVSACGQASLQPTQPPANTSLPSNTPLPPPTATPPPSPTPTIPPTWTVISTDLATAASWTEPEVMGEFDVSILNDTLVITAPEDVYANPINFFTHLELSSGDFGVTFEMESATADFAGISIYGALSQGDWWEGITRLDIGIKGGKVAVGYWNGTSPSPSVWNEYSVSGIYAGKKVELGLQKLGDDLIVLAKGKEIARLTDPGLFAALLVYLGVNVAPANQLTLYSLSVLENEGAPITIR